MRMLVGVALASSLVAASPAASAAEPVDWSVAQPVAAVAVHRLAERDVPATMRDARGDGSGCYVVEARIFDAVTGATLSRPRLVTRGGETASIELGELRSGALSAGIRLTVSIDEAGDAANTTTEVRHGGAVVATSTGRFAIAPT